MALGNLLQLTPQPRRERGRWDDAVWRYFNIRQAMPRWYTVMMQQSRAKDSSAR